MRPVYRAGRDWPVFFSHQGAVRNNLCNLTGSLGKSMTVPLLQTEFSARGSCFRGVRVALLVALALTAAPRRNPAAAAPAVARLPRTDLMLYHGAGGEVLPVKTPADWERRRQEVWRGMQEIVGPLPGEAKRCPLEVKVEAETDCGGYVRRLLTYAAEPGGRVPAYLLVPKAALAS